MTILVIGKTGQLARAINTVAGDAVICLNRMACDLSKDEVHITSALAPYAQVKAMIIAAAYTAVNKAQSEPQLARAVNANGPKVIASFCARHNIPVIHISTDYVFNGEADTPYKVSDAPAPINVYGETKLAGEIAVRDSGARAAIVRTSWVYDATGRNFVTTMQRLKSEGAPIKVVNDQWGRPTSATDLASAVLTTAKAMIGGHEGGLFHVSGSGDPTTWHGFAREILGDYPIEAVGSEAFKTDARRPRYSVLDTTKFDTEFGAPLRNWKDALQAALGSIEH